jgi:Tfp pilus assembly major pilin PilA
MNEVNEMFFRNEKGLATEMAMIFVVFFLLLAASLSMVSTQETRFAGFDRNRVTAEYAAQAGVKIGIDHIRALILLEKASNTISGSFSGKLSTSVGAPQYSVVYQPNNNLVNPDYINVTATATYNGVTSRSIVHILLGNEKKSIPNPGVIPLIENSHDFSNDEKWTVSGDPPICRPPVSSLKSFKQVLFHDTLDANFKVSYNITLDKKNLYDSGGTGYGVYYMANGDADNMTGYIFQYDPGANIGTDGGAFFVKKVIAGKSSTTSPWQNETRNYTLGFQDNGNDSLGNNTGTTRMSIGNDTTNGTFIKTMNTYYTAMNAAGKKRLDGSSYPAQFYLTTEDAKAAGYEESVAAEYARHTIAIEVRDDDAPTAVKRQVTTTTQVPIYKKGKITGYKSVTTTSIVTESVILKRHYVSCDGQPILNFVDFDNANPISSVNAGTGLRVWNARVTFNNNISESYGQVVTRNIDWVKP